MVFQWVAMRRRYSWAQGVSSMLWFVFAFLLIFGVSAISVQAAVLNKRLHFEWMYDKNYPSVAGFNIYQNDKAIISIDDHTIVALDLNVDLRTDEANKFTITAFDVGGEESAHSAPYVIDLRSASVANLHFLSLLLLKK